MKIIRGILGLVLFLLMVLFCTFALADLNINTTFTDSVFREYVKKYFDTDKNGFLSNTEIANAERIDVSQEDEKEISSLKGVENLSYLKELNCTGCQLTSLNVAGLSRLESLRCEHNKLTTLNINGCTNLNSLYCKSNCLTSLDLSECTKISYLECSDNKLTSLDTSSCMVLNHLSCSNNQLTSLKIGNTCETVYCENNKLTSLDLSKVTAISGLLCQNNQLKELDLSNCDMMHTLNCSGNQLTSLDLSKSTKIRYLTCYDNQLTSLDLRNNTVIYELYCRDNKLTTMILGKNATIHYLECEHNNLECLDVSVCYYLNELVKNKKPKQSKKDSSVYIWKDIQEMLDYEEEYEETLIYLSADKTCTVKSAMALINDCDIDDIADQIYTGGEIVPKVTVKENETTLVEGTDYTLSYSNNINAGTATVTVIGIGQYGGSQSVTFTIKSADINDCSVTDISEQKYTGAEIRPEVTVFFNEMTLRVEIDYTVAYTNNIQPGTAKVILTGKGNFTGKKEICFTIVSNDDQGGQGGSETEKTDLSGAIIAKIKNQIYTGEVITPTLTVTCDGKTLVADTDYMTTYSNNTNVGTAIVTITGIGNYTGSISSSFKIVPRKLENLKLKSGKKQLTLKWKVDKSVTGYEIEYSLKKNFKNAKLITIKDSETDSIEISKLKEKKTYYVRIRAFKKVKGKKYYSDWSKTLSKKTK